MKLIIVEARFAPGKIDQAVATFEAQADAVRAMKGCESYAIYQNGNSIAIVQKWRGATQFDAYRASSIFASLGMALKPLMDAPPVTTLASIDTL